MRSFEFTTEADLMNEMIPLIPGRGKRQSSPQGPNNPNAKVGTQSQSVDAQGPTVPSPPVVPSAPVAPGQQMNTKPGQPAKPMAKLAPGSNIEMPTDNGQLGNFKITKITGNDIEIENPDHLKNPNEPERITYNKADLIKALGMT